MGTYRRSRKGTRKTSLRKARNYYSRTVQTGTGEEILSGIENSGSGQIQEAVIVSETKEKSADETAAALELAKSVFGFFREISAIPRGSFHTDAISDYLVSFARDRGLSYVRDNVNNVIITKPASEGAEEADPVALQGHIDMVLASDPEKGIDMLTTPVSIIVDGDWMHADGTTLGADNGIAVAMMLAILDDKSLVHPDLECVFTSDEEVGLIGASAIDLSGLRSRRLLNLDSEEEGVFCAGCAGGAEVVCEMPLRKKERSGRVLRLMVSDLRGGHSGADIHIGRANANVLISRALYRLFREVPFRLISIDGGDADNAIATNAEARILFSEKEDPEKVFKAFELVSGKISAEYSVTDPDIRWSAFWEAEKTANAVSKKDTGRLVSYLISLPNGVTAMNPVLSGKPQTSLNLGILRTAEKGLRAEFMIRSSVNTQTNYLAERVVCITKGFGGKPAVRSSYPAWEFRNDSPFRNLAAEVYRKVNGKEAAVEVIHAGLECGILSGKVEGLDCISTGPDLENVHTIRERMSISSVGRVWSFVLALLEEAAAV